MKTHRIIAAPLAALALAAVAGFAPAGQDAAADRAAAVDAPTFAVDPVHSTAIFRVHHLNAGQFYGRFNDVTGTFSYAEGDVRGPSFDVTIAIGSVDTNNERLDNHLKSPDFFNEREYPQMTFKSRSARALGGNAFEVTGDLTIRETTQTIKPTITLTGITEKRCGFETIFEIERSEFGVMYGVDNGALGNTTRIIVGLEGIKQADDA